MALLEGRWTTEKRESVWDDLGEELREIPSSAEESEEVAHMGGGKEKDIKAFNLKIQPFDWARCVALDSKNGILVSRVPFNNSTEVITTHVMIGSVEERNGEIPSSLDYDEAKTTEDDAVQS